MTREIHTFDNGIKVFNDHLLPAQKKRYEVRNVHEAEEEDIFISLIQKIPENGHFVNVGSAIGYYALLARKISPAINIHVYEPLDRHVKFFIENIKLNNMDVKDFNIHTEGVSVKPGKALLNDISFGSHIFYSPDGNVNPNLTVKKIDAINLIQLVDRIDGTINLLQMDVQGLEFAILAGGQKVLEKGLVSTFLIGTHGIQLHNKCLNILKNHGYTIQHDNFQTKFQPDGILVASKITV